MISAFSDCTGVRHFKFLTMQMQPSRISGRGNCGPFCPRPPCSQTRPHRLNGRKLARSDFVFLTILASGYRTRGWGYPRSGLSAPAISCVGTKTEHADCNAAMFASRGLSGKTYPRSELIWFLTLSRLSRPVSGRAGRSTHERAVPSIRPAQRRSGRKL